MRNASPMDASLVAGAFRSQVSLPPRIHQPPLALAKQTALQRGGAGTGIIAVPGRPMRAAARLQKYVVY